MDSLTVARSMRGSIGMFRKWCNHACQTFGQLLDVVHTKLMIHFHKWCMENPERRHAFLQEEKGIPMTKIMAWYML